jgi:hypothetical protein
MRPEIRQWLTQNITSFNAFPHFIENILLIPRIFANVFGLGIHP